MVIFNVNICCLHAHGSHTRTHTNVNGVFCLTPAEDVMMETVVEVSTECGPIEEESFPIPSECEPAAKKKRGQCHCGTPDVTWDSPRLNVKLTIKQFAVLDSATDEPVALLH